MLAYLTSYFSTWFDPSLALFFTHAAVVLTLVVVGGAADQITKRVLLQWVGYVSKKSTTRLDDVLLNTKVFDRLAHLVPASVIYVLVPVLYKAFPSVASIVQSACQAYMLWIALLVVDSILRVIEGELQRSPLGKKISFKSYIQIAKLLIYFFGVLLILSVLLGKSPVVFLSSLGAFTAVMMLVFKDTILGFVASIQLSTNNMVVPGDWVSLPEFNTDGDVIEVGLTTVKIQNWDKSISMVPTYKLVTHSFRNWRGMAESGGRRVKRSISIDMDTVMFCSPALLKKSKKLHYLKDYIERKEEEIAAYNAERKVDSSHPANGRRLTNLGLFRAYLNEYLKHHPAVHQEMTMLVRQLQSTSTGIPIEVYMFSNDLDWANYEGLQADVFDHILAILPEFELSVFQVLGK